MKHKREWGQCPIDISDDDVINAMKTIPGFLDITPSDFREIYMYAYRQAMERLGHALTARQIMTTKVIFVTEEASLLHTALLLAAHTISGAPVVDSLLRVKGVISEKDFLVEMGKKKETGVMGLIAECLKNKGCLAAPFREKTARDLMTSPPWTVHGETPVVEIAALFEEKKINRVPVVERDQTLIGIVTRSDIVQSYCTRPI